MLLVCGAANVNAQDDMAGQVLARINQARADAGLPLLTRNAQLDAAAQAHADDLQKNGTSLGHRGSDGSTIKQRIARAGYGGETTGENWAAYRTLDQIMTFWLNDPPHRRNILHPKFREIGIGVARRANGGLIVITDFGAPGKIAEIATPAVPPKQPIKNSRAAPTQVKPAAPKLTRAPTRQPTAKPTRAREENVPAPPTVEPTRIALASVPHPQPGTPAVLRARGRIAKRLVLGHAASDAGALRAPGDPWRMTLGAGLALGGMLLLGVAVVGHLRYRTRQDLWNWHNH